MSKGPACLELIHRYANSGSCPLTVLTGEGSDSARTAASVKLPGLYVISPGHVSGFSAIFWK
jgi:hypothetical protein